MNTAVLKAPNAIARYVIEVPVAQVGHLELLLRAPNAIERLKELVLGAALRGNLLPGGQRRTRSAAAESSKRRPPLIHEFEIAEGWRWARVGELCELRTGATPSTSKREYYGGDIRWLVSGDINRGVIFDCDGRITEAAVASSNCKILPIDSVLIALNGQGKTRATVALLRVPATCNQSLVAMSVRAGVELTPEFLLWNLRYRYREIRRVTGEDQRRGLNMGLVSELSVAVAPIAEQHRIVARVEELMKLCDALEQSGRLADEQHARLTSTLFDALGASESAHALAENWQRVAEHFDLLLDRPEAIGALETTLLTLALQGRLVPKCAAEVPTGDMAQNIEAERHKPIDPKEIPFELPPNWRWVRLGWLAELINGDRGKNYPNKAEYVPTGVPFINTGHIEPDGTLSRESMHYLKREKFESLRGGKTRPGDLVYCLRGATLGKTAIVEYEEGAIASSLVIIRLNEAVAQKYAYYFLISPLGKALVKRFDNGSAQPNLAANSVKQYVMPLPPLAEQHRIVARVDELRALCAQLSERLTDGRRAQTQLADALVAQAVG